MNIFNKKLFFVLISLLLFLFSIKFVEAGNISGRCMCDGEDAGTIDRPDIGSLRSLCAEICARDPDRGEARIVADSLSCVTDGEMVNEEEGVCEDSPPASLKGGGEEKDEAEKSTVKAIELDSPLVDEEGQPITDIVPLIGRIIKTALGVVGAIALLMFIYGGLIWLTSGGTPDKIKKGMDVLLWAAIGLVVIFASYTLVDFVFEAFGV